MAHIHVDAGTTEEFTTGKFKMIKVGVHEIGVIRLRNGAYRAVRNWCPHKGAPICKGQVGGTWPPCEATNLEFDREGEILACPWHGFEYDLDTGRELYWQNPTRLRLYPVKVIDDHVMVTVPEARARNASAAEAED